MYAISTLKEELVGLEASAPPLALPLSFMTYPPQGISLLIPKWDSAL